MLTTVWINSFTVSGSMIFVFLYMFMGSCGLISYFIKTKAVYLGLNFTKKNNEKNPSMWVGRVFIGPILSFCWKNHISNKLFFHFQIDFWSYGRIQIPCLQFRYWEKSVFELCRASTIQSKQIDGFHWTTTDKPEFTDWSQVNLIFGCWKILISNEGGLLRPLQPPLTIFRVNG